MCYATGIGGPGWKAGSNRSGSRIFEIIIRQNLVHETKLRFATRLNSFGSRPDAYWPKGHGKPSPLELAERASKAEGLTDVDLNYPDHVGSDPRVTGEEIRDLGLAVNGLAMRYYSIQPSRSELSPIQTRQSAARRLNSPNEE